MIPAISTTALSRRYRDQAALDDVSLVVEPGTVTGLLGRNGAGKTTLMRIVTGQEFPTRGAIRVFGQAPAENDAVLRRMVFVREEQAYPDFRVGHAIRVASWFYPNWDQELARRLLADFDLPLGQRIKKLSRGMRSAVGITIGLAARAELTLWRVPAVTSLVQQHERGSQDQPVHGQREEAGRRAILAVRPAQPVDVGVRDHRRDGGHGADHGRRRETDRPVPAHRVAPRRIPAAEPLGADRGRISELSRKQQG